MPKCDFSKVAEISLQHGCSVNLLHIFRIHFIITPLEGCFYSHRRSSVKRSVHKDFAKFTGKHQCLNLYFNKIASLRTVNLLKKRLRHRCFSENFVKFLRTQFCRAPQADFFCQWCVSLSISFTFRAFTFEDQVSDEIDINQILTLTEVFPPKSKQCFMICSFIYSCI